MLTSDLNLSKNCKRIEILKCVLRTSIIIIIIIIIKTVYDSRSSSLQAFKSLSVSASQRAEARITIA